MPKNIQKSIQRYFSKIKTNRPPQLRLSSKKWISLKGCKHPRTPSFSLDNNKNNNNNDDEATLADVDRFLFENFKSLYLDDDKETGCNNNTKRVVSSDEEEEEEEEEEETREEKYSKLVPILFDSSNETPLDLCGSNRFFLTRGFSGSMTNTTTTTTNTFEETGSCSNSSTSKNSNINSSSKEDEMNIPDNCVVVLASSPSPYDDFRRSMQETVEGRLRDNQTVDWDFMEELLFCYMNLNEKKSYKFILSAFCDLIGVMRQSSEPKPVKPRSVRTVRIGREVMKKKTKELTLKFEGSRY